MRGVKSFAMLLCVSPSPGRLGSPVDIDASQATSAEGKEAGIEFVRPPEGSKPGERIYFEGEKYESKCIDHRIIRMMSDITALRCSAGTFTQPEEEGLRDYPACMLFNEIAPTLPIISDFDAVSGSGYSGYS